MFDIQRFGDRDTVNSSFEGKLLVEFYDGDNRTVTVDSPKEDLTANDVNGLVNWMKTNQPLIGDKAGASIVGASKFMTIKKTEKKLDIS